MGDNKEQATILIVDDTPENITILRKLLENYTLRVAINGERALALAEMEPVPDLIILDIMMPGMDGYQVCEKLKAAEKTKHIPVIFISALGEERNQMKGFQLGAVDYITKPFSPSVVRARVKSHLELKKHRDRLEELIQERTHELELTQEVTVECLGSLAEYRDMETGNHVKRMKCYIKLLAEKLKNHPRFEKTLTDSMIEMICKSAPLHDIGKVGVPDKILKKPGRLTAEEFEEMKRHTLYGRDALAHSARKLGKGSFLHVAQEMAYTHHERWDGTGYPEGLSGEAIPVVGRLMALSDVYDALISRRVYKDPFSHEETVKTIMGGNGTHFDPDVVAAFLELEKEFEKIALDYNDDEAAKE